MSSKALFIVRATPRNFSGADVAFDVADGTDVHGRPTFSGNTRRQVPPLRTVLAIPVGRADLKIGLYKVAAGAQMKLAGSALLPGDVVAITCPPDGPEGLPALAGTTWTVVDDGTVVSTTAAAARAIGASIDELASRVPPPFEPPAEPEQLAEPPEVDESLQPEG